MEKCCELREARKDGWDDEDGHHEEVLITKIGKRWYVKAEWYTLGILYCPWCGQEMDGPPKVRREEVPEANDINFDALMDAVNKKENR